MNWLTRKTKKPVLLVIFLWSTASPNISTAAAPVCDEPCFTLIAALYGASAIPSDSAGSTRQTQRVNQFSRRMNSGIKQAALKSYSTSHNSTNQNSTNQNNTYPNSTNSIRDLRVVDSASVGGDSGAQNTGKSFQSANKNPPSISSVIVLGAVLTPALIIGITAFFAERRRRENAESALRKSRQWYEAQFIRIPVPTFTWQSQDDDFRLVDFNNAALAWTHNGVKSLLGKSISEIYQHDRPDIVEDIHKCFDEKAEIHKTFWYTNVSEGSKHYVDVTYAFVPDNLVLVHIGDITERKLAEDNLQRAHQMMEQRVSQRTLELQLTNSELTQEIQRRLQAEKNLRAERDKAQYCIENVSAIIVGLDIQGNIILINPLACKLLERTEKDMIGGNWFDIALPEDIRDETFNTFRQAVSATHNTIDYYENPIVSRSGRQYLIAWKNNILRDAQGGFTNCLSVGEDITQRRKAEELLRTRQAEMAHFARITTVGEITSALTHELSQPLTAINIYAGSCIQQLDSKEYDRALFREALELIAQQGQRAANIIQNLRQYLSKGNFERKNCDINDLIRQTGEIAFLDVKNANIKIHYELSEGLSPILANPVQIEQVIFNLLRNSLQALFVKPEQNRQIWIKSRSLDCNSVAVSVTDNGPGIVSDDMEKIFEPFYTTKTDGMGLGLAISHSIIQSHGGHFQALNAPHGGAIFTFTLPTKENSHD